MSEDQFTKLFTYMQQRFDAIDGRLEQVDLHFDQLQRAADGCVKEVLDLREEVGMIEHRLNRHEAYVQAIAQKVGAKLQEVKT